ncbi:hypothetical protein RND71_032761 [Anisodus tanguticus]|uniref:Uncharacterized protein n=1 Tax=Anisodus tanguticus TaxID=243964 RepID=A0AAE1R936_9SOLA|nr:hypothetical protein RND71_032761 [Anisodus tanguticus]
MPMATPMASPPTFNKPSIVLESVSITSRPGLRMLVIRKFWWICCFGRWTIPHLPIICSFQERDFSNAIHQLRMRYNILLAQPIQASPALASAATNVWQWTSLAAGGSPRELAFGANTLRQESIPITTPITQPISANQPAYSNANVNTNTNASSPQRLSNPAAYSNANVNTNTNASGPQRLSNPAYSNANANANASGPQRLSNHGRNVDTKTKTIYIAKNSNQLNITGGSSMPARIEEILAAIPHTNEMLHQSCSHHIIFS